MKTLKDKVVLRTLTLELATHQTIKPSVHNKWNHVKLSQFSAASLQESSPAELRHLSPDGSIGGLHSYSLAMLHKRWCQPACMVRLSFPAAADNRDKDMMWHGLSEDSSFPVSNRKQPSAWASSHEGSIGVLMVFQYFRWCQQRFHFCRMRLKEIPMSVCSAIPVQRSMHFAALQNILRCTSKDGILYALRVCPVHMKYWLQMRCKYTAVILQTDMGTVNPHLSETLL